MDLLVRKCPEVLGMSLVLVASVLCLIAACFQVAKILLVFLLGILIRLSGIMKLIICLVLQCEETVHIIVIYTLYGCQSLSIVYAKLRLLYRIENKKRMKLLRGERLAVRYVLRTVIDWRLVLRCLSSGILYLVIIILHNY